MFTITISANQIRSIIAHARRIGIDTDRVLGRAGLVEADLDAESDLDRLWLAYNRLGSEIQTKLSKAQGLRPLDEIDKAVLLHYLIGATNLREVVERFVAFTASHRERIGFDYEIEELPGMVVLHGKHHARPSDDIVLLSALRSMNSFTYMLSWLSASRVTPLRIALPGVPVEKNSFPLWGADAPIVSSAGGSELWLAAPALEKMVVRDLADVKRILSCVREAVIGVSVQLSLLDLASEMIERHCHATGQMLTLQQLAVALNTSESTLYRRFREAGSGGFSALRQRCQMRLATHFLTTTKWTVDIVAARVGFQDGNAFRRSFKRWTGTTPSAYRQMMHASTTA